ncbi:MAG: hypothetical protein Q8K96_17210 [Rubrivivax sp.]|nr:hypothetical protein [Rubrivivax sp.]
MLKAAVLAVALTAATMSIAQTADAKKALVAKVLQLQQPGIESLARTLTEQPAMQLLQQAGLALQRLPAERRETLGREIEADVRKYMEETTPIVRERAVKLAPTTIGKLIDERFTEEELRQIVALLESPVNRKFQALAGEMQRAIGQPLVAESRPEVEVKLRALEASVSRRLAPPPASPASAAPRAPATKPSASTAKKPA